MKKKNREDHRIISAILLAAGESKRMGQPKMALPWGDTTMLGRVVETFASAGIEDLVVVTGGGGRAVDDLVDGLASRFPLRRVFNADYERGEMLSSIQAGLAALGSGQEAALIGLGDQPQVRADTILRICSAFMHSRRLLIVPSFENHRGHPWLIARSLWNEFLSLPQGTTPRQFLRSRAGSIDYLAIEDDSILRDVDTPEAYARQNPKK